MTRHDSDSGPTCGIPNTKNILSHHFHDQVPGYTSHSNAQTRVQWLATPLFQPDPLQLASRQGLIKSVILPTWDRTENLTVNSPTPTPTKPRWL